MALPAYKNTNPYTVSVPLSEGIGLNVPPNKYIVGPHFSEYPLLFPGFILAYADSASVSPQSDIIYTHAADPTEISGYSGISGFSGYSGKSGYSGYSGTSGYSGVGIVAVSGYAGIEIALSGADGEKTLWVGYSL
jgi:hypothetical protein